MASVAAVLSLCVGALTSCPSGLGPECIWKLPFEVEVFTAALAVSPDDTLVAVVNTMAQPYRRVSVYDTATGAQLDVEPFGVAAHIAFSPRDASGLRFAVASDTGVAIFSVNRGTTQMVWEVDAAGPAAAVAFSPDGAHLATSHSDDDRIHIRDVVTGSAVSSFSGVALSQLQYTPDGTRLIGTSWDQDHGAVVWDASTGARIQVYAGPMVDVAFSPDGKHFATATSSSIIAIRSLGDYSTLHTARHVSGVYDVAFTRDSASLIVAGRSASIDVYSVASGTKHTSLPTGMLMTGAVAALHNSNRFLAITGPRSFAPDLFLWDPSPASPPAPPSGIHNVAGVP